MHWEKGYGIADVETGAPVDHETMFQAASISKPVAAMAVLKAVQDGLFTLDDDINDILTSWTLDGGEFTANRPVTPRGLTSHTAGLGDGFGFPGYDPDVELPTVVQILDGHELSNVGPLFMEREPGSTRAGCTFRPPSSNRPCRLCPGQFGCSTGTARLRWISAGIASTSIRGRRLYAFLTANWATPGFQLLRILWISQH